MPPLHLRQEFPTLRHFKEALHAWAIEAHFEPRILKSDTGRVRVGCKRDPNCPFVIRCNWERKQGREPLARVTVLRDRHTCLNGLNGSGGGGWEGDGGGGGAGAGMMMMADRGLELPQLEIRTDPATGSIIGGARVLGPVPSARSLVHGASQHSNGVTPAPLPLPKVQRNSASRLPFLMEILPRLMTVTKETTPGEIRECLMREYGAEVHLQQCRRAKTEILKLREQEGHARMGGGGGGGGGPDSGVQVGGVGGGSLDGMGSSDNGDGTANMFSNSGPVVDSTPGLQTPSTMHATPSIPSGGEVGGPGTEYPLPLHTASGVVIPQATPRREAALSAVAEQPIRCPYCVNLRWMRTVRDAVEHMSMHVVV